MRVLVCDDEPDIRMLYRSAFEECGAEVRTAEDGGRGIELASSFEPDLVVLDLRMPGRDGLSALPDIVACCPAANVLIVSAYVSADQFGLLRDLGAAECYDKMDFLTRIPRVMSQYAPAA